MVSPLAPPSAVPVAPPGRPLAAGEVRVGILLPFTGAHAALGEALLNAASLALFDHGGDTVTLLPKDTGSTGSGADSAVRAALGEGARVVVGPLLASSVRAAAPAARQAAVPVLAFSNDSSVAGEGVFIMGVTPAQQVARVVALARAQGHARFAALAPDTPFGNAVVSALFEAAEASGGAVDRVELFVPGQVSVSENEEVRRLAAAAKGGAFDALLIAAGGADLRTMAPLLPYYGVDPDRIQLLGTELWHDPAVLGEPALLGGWFAAQPDDAFDQFRGRYQSVYGAEPPRLAALAYDAVALVAALARSPRGPDFSRAVLTDADGFAGIDGIFRFGDDGVNQRGLAVYRIAARTFEVVDPAPASFAAPAF